MRRDLIKNWSFKGGFVIALLTVPMLLTGCAADKYVIKEKVEASNAPIESTIEEKGDVVDEGKEAKTERESRPIYAGSVVTTQFSEVLKLDENEGPVGSYTFPENSTYAFENGGYVYYSTWKSEGDTYGYEVKRKELSSGNEEYICDVPGVRSLDVYNGYVFVRSYSYDDAKYDERKFDVNTLEELPNDANNALFDTIGDKSTCSDLRGRESCLDRLMDEVGFIAAYDYKESRVTCKAKNAEDVAVYDLENSYEIYAYDKYDLVYSCSVEDENDYWAKNLMMLDLQGDATFVIAERFNSFLDYANGKIYYSMIDESEFGLEEYEVHAFDTETKVDSVLYKQKKHPGMPIYGPGICDFKVLNKNIYFLSDDGNEVCWYTIPSDSDAKATPERTEVILADSNAPKGVSIEGISETRLCDKCGKPLIQAYSDYPVFDLKLYDETVYAKINDYLKKEAKSRVELALSDNEYVVEGTEACDKHGTASYKVTNEYELQEIRDVASSYITVEYNGYWYAGGAHGMPLYTYYLFDKSTGDEVKLKDLYKGSEEDFKKLVADKVMAYAETFDEDNTPFLYSGDDLYNEAFQGASLEGSDIIWENDGVKVVYAPYVLGPYAAGPIEIAVSYKDLGIEGYFK